MMSNWTNILKIGYFLWSFYIIVKILWILSWGIKAHILSNFKCFRVNLIEKYGTWAVVTGSSDGLGKAYAMELAKRGMNVVLISRSREKLEKIASEIEHKYNVKTRIIVADFFEGRKMYEHIETQLRDIPVGILINNVGSQQGPIYFSEMSSQEIVNTVNVNVRAAMFMTRMVLLQMQERKKGAIINVTSPTAGRTVAMASLYTASKTYLQTFTEILRVECRKYGITVQRVSPCGVRTPMALKSSKLLRDNPWIMISPGTYAAGALNTLGLVNHTAGHWSHGIQLFILNCIPDCIYTTISEIALKNTRREIRSRK